MKKSIINTLITTAFIASLGFAATSAIARGADFEQQRLMVQVLQAKQKLQQAQAAKGVEQQKLMGEHMQMLHDDMKACREMKPKAGMTEKERDEWFAEHQKIMDDMMTQMMDAHKVEMISAPCDTDKK
jgi:preprotein translocase subunit SecF